MRSQCRGITNAIMSILLPVHRWSVGEGPLSRRRHGTNGILLRAEHTVDHVIIAGAWRCRVRQNMRLEVPGPLDPVEGGPERHGVGEVVPGTSAPDLRKAN
jgi:hypothetical protein